MLFLVDLAIIILELDINLTIDVLNRLAFPYFLIVFPVLIFSAYVLLPS